MRFREELLEITKKSIERLRALDESGQGPLSGMKLPEKVRQEKSFGATSITTELRVSETGKEGTLVDLERKAKQCKKCSLSKTRRNVVFSDGSTRSGVVFVGEAPGREEDMKGKPFVGEAGKLLTRIIQSIGFKREDVYIANVLKCRPPQNRDPLQEEIKACLPILIEQLELARPKIICPLGKFAAQTLTGAKDPISVLRGRVYLYKGVKVIPTYHPAALLRNPDLKRPVWQDMKLLRREYELLSSPLRGS